MAQRRKQFVLTPQYHALETRLALSGNFLSHGFADISREFNQLVHHHSAEHSTMKTDNILGRELPTLNHHLQAHQTK